MKDYKIKVSVSGDFDTIVRAENPVMALKILADEFSSMKFKMTLDKENVDFISLESSDETIGENTSKVSTFLSKTDGFKMKDFSFKCSNASSLEDIDAILSFFEEDDDYDEDDDEYFDEDEDFEMDCEECPYFDECKRKEQLE